MNAKWKQRIDSAALPVCSVLGVLVAFGIVLSWFPKTWDAWNLPLQEIDAPAHYYFIRKLLREGIGAATRLWPNDAYYPPMFHIIAAVIISTGQALGIKVNIYTAFNLVWLVTSGLVWPAGVSLWASYWTRKVDGEFADRWESRFSRSYASRGSLKNAGESSLKDSQSRAGGGAGANAAASFPPINEKRLWPAIMGLLAASWRPFSCAMMLIVPLLAVASASHPFQMLLSGPLIAFGLATTLLPYWLYATLRLFDAIAARFQISRWLTAAVLLGVLCVFAHPRIAFTWLLLMAPFMLLRLPWKLILGAFVAVVICAVAFFFYMIGHYHSSRYLDPSSWFHTYVPNRSVPDALRVFFTDNIGGAAGWFMAAMVIAALVAAIVVVIAFFRSRLVVVKFDKRSAAKVRHGIAAEGNASAGTRSDTESGVAPESGVASPVIADSGDSYDSKGVYDIDRYDADRPASRFVTPTTSMAKDAVSLVLAFALVCLVYVCSTSLTGWFPNIVAGAWYRAETRPLTMIPLASIPLLVFAACAVAVMTEEPVADGARAGDVSQRVSVNLGKLIAVLVLAALAISCQFGNTTRNQMSASLANNSTLDGKPENGELNRAKYDVLKQTVKMTGNASVIISDPLNGSMYGSAMFDANMLYPIYNAMREKNGAIFPATESAFDSGDPAKLSATTCPIDGDVPKYFLSMGPQAPSLQMFTFRQQYDTFHRQDLIDGYVKNGTLVKVKDFSSEGDYAKDWALYRITCGK
ncbi:DUF6541 family protein [Bifidobacterium sp. ESL0745]|uniref:DUF6541 family protein n=1 Tax=Bifidobacterium sp. ESL0745 TaxID=2983226 RepID=UPI0023F77529|nr:DUF6541 family protein [Bifidobacterium sp. ESL0745]MDF7665796.1 hypothetical protein [Bifidobacterium sp. ESL0745]